MRRFTTCITALLILILAGCSSSNVTTPVNPQPQQDGINSTLPVWVSDYDSNSNPSAGQGLMGIFSVHIDPVTLEGDFTSLRSSGAVDVLEVVDISNFLSVAPCTDCVSLKSVEINASNQLVAKIGIRHPFPAGDSLKPISGQNRGDLHVFNIEGIVVSDGASVNAFPLLGVSTGGFNLVNADGLTGYLDSPLDDIYPTDANIHPFITHFDDYSQGNFDPSNPMGFQSVTTPPPSGNLVMPMGSDEDIQDYIFDFPAGDIDFIFAVGCSYGVSSESKSQRFNPVYRVPQHNKKAASFVNVVIDSNDLVDDDPLAEAQLTIEILDINHGVTVGLALNEMYSDSSISAIIVEVPGVTLSSVAFSTTPTGGDGRDPADPLTFVGTIQNDALGAAGTYSGLVKVTDSYQTGQNVLPLLGGMDGIKRVSPVENPLTGLFPIQEFATYQTFQIDVAVGNDAPTAVLAPDPATGCDGATITFNATGSSDTDGTIDLYEFDFDYDGINFIADVSGVDAIVQSTAYSIGNYTAALRVTDNQTATDIDTVPVTIANSGVFDISGTTKKYVTDSSFSGIIFTPNGFSPSSTQNRQFGLEAMATNSNYVFAVFYASGISGTGVYLARSSDNGDSWGDYNLVHTMTPSASFAGTAIDVIGSEVFIAVGETGPQRLFLSYNDTDGTGLFTEYQVSSSRGYGSISVAVDPSDTDNIYLSTSRRSYFQEIYIYTSNSGPSGTFTEQMINTWYRPPPFGYFTQGYTMELKVASDQDVYISESANASVAFYKSTDLGGSFTQIYGSWDPQGSWGRDSDFCIDPNDPETLHWVTTFRVPSAYRHVYRRSTNGGVTWGVRSNNLHGSTTAYTNAAVCNDSSSNVYIVYTDTSSGNAEVYGRFSDNGGDTFGTSFQISSDTLNDGHVEIITTTNGCDVVVGWLEDRDGTRRVVSRRG